MTEQSTNKKNRKEVGESREVEPRHSSGGMLRKDPYWSSSDFLEANPFSLMRRFADHMDRAFGGGAWADFGRERAGMWSPAIEVSERDNKLMVRADLPGLKKEDVKVEAVDNALVIQGERRHEEEEHNGGYHRSERRYGSFYRSIPLPEGAQTEQARAEFRDGVLEVSVPVAETQKRCREVPIEIGASPERK